jgi:hypothetical protein
LPRSAPDTLALQNNIVRASELSVLSAAKNEAWQPELLCAEDAPAAARQPLAHNRIVGPRHF